MNQGKVYFVGAGPGDPDLLTVKAHRLIGQADVIVYDGCALEDCLAHARKDADLVYTGVAPGREKSRPAEINDLLAREAAGGNSVVRLRGGDSPLQALGGEEAEHLAARGVTFEFVPGIASTPAGACTPVTHRARGPAPGVQTAHAPASSMYYPIQLSLEGGQVLVFGGGKVAQRRVDRLLEAGARVRVVSPVLSAALMAHRDLGGVDHVEGGFDPVQLEGAVLAFAATDDAAVNRQVADEARARGIWVNVADNPLACDFTLPACVIRGSLVLSVSTNARSPGLSAALRRRLDDQFGPEWSVLTRLLSDIRPDLLRLGLPPTTVTERIATVLDSDVLSLIRQGQEEEARLMAIRILLPHAV